MKRTIRITGLAAWAVVLAVLLGTISPATAQTPPPKDDVLAGPVWKSLGLTDEQLDQVRKIMQSHREDSHQALLEKLGKVLDENQIEKLDAHFKNAPRMRGKPHHKPRMRGGHHGRHSREMKNGGGECGSDCSCGSCGHAMKRGRGRHGHAMRGGGHGAGPHMGAKRGEGALRMIDRMKGVLDLTDDQVKEMREIVEQQREQFKDFDPSSLSADERAETRKAHRMLLHTRLKSVLTEEQSKKFDEWMESRPGRGKRGMRG